MFNNNLRLPWLSIIISSLSVVIIDGLESVFCTFASKVYEFEAFGAKKFLAFGTLNFSEKFRAVAADRLRL